MPNDWSNFFPSSRKPLNWKVMKSFRFAARGQSFGRHVCFTCSESGLGNLTTSYSSDKQASG